MTLFFATLRALAPLFLLIVLGYALKKRRLLHAAHVPVFNGLVMNVTMPALIVRGLLGTPRFVPQMLLPPLAALAAEAGVLAIALGVGKLMRLPRHVQGALLIIAAFGNTGFLGYPITLALLPRQFPVAILIDQFGMTIAMYLLAVVIGAVYGVRHGETRETLPAILKFLRGPMLVSLTLGLVLRLAPWPDALIHAHAARALGAVLWQCLGYLGAGTTPVVLLALGVALRPSAARSYAAPMAAACALKLIACPLLMWCVCRALHLHGELLTVGVLQAAMPTAVMASVLCAEHDLAGDFAVGVVFVGTAVSAVSVPVLLSVLR